MPGAYSVRARRLIVRLISLLSEGDRAVKSLSDISSRVMASRDASIAPSGAARFGGGDGGGSARRLNVGSLGKFNGLGTLLKCKLTRQAEDVLYNLKNIEKEVELIRSELLRASDETVASASRESSTSQTALRFRDVVAALAQESLRREELLKSVNIHRSEDGSMNAFTDFSSFERSWTCKVGPAVVAKLKKMNIDTAPLGA